MLSILIPTYNYNVLPLVKVLHKQASETDMPFEILVNDDGSTLYTQENQSIEDLPHCTYTFQKNNLGRTATRQALAQSSKFERLLFLDADVMPKSNGFIGNFNLNKTLPDVVFGGICYEKKRPPKAQMLKWKYGKKNEAKPLSVRKKMPYLSIISGSLLVKKNVFLQANSFLENTYGVDVLFCHNLQQMQVSVGHIDNPVVHLGLENNDVFLSKTKQGLDALYRFSEEHKIPNNYRPIQKSFFKLKKFGLNTLFSATFSALNKPIERNLCSKNPSLFLFDLYRLGYLCSL